MNIPPAVPSRRRNLCLHAVACSALVLGAVIIGCKSAPTPTAQDLFAAGTARAEKAIRDTVADPERREEALRIISSYAIAEREFLDRTIAIRDGIFRLHRNYGTTREQYMERLDALKENRRAFAESMIPSWGGLMNVLENDEKKAVIAQQQLEEELWRTKIQ